MSGSSRYMRSHVGRTETGTVDQILIAIVLSGCGFLRGQAIDGACLWHIVKESPRVLVWPSWPLTICVGTCARLCHSSGGELEQIQFLLGHVSVQTKLFILTLRFY